MTLTSEIRLGVQSMTGDLDGVLFTVADIMRYINHGINEIVKRTRCTQKTVTVTAATLTSTDIYGGVLLPADFLMELDVYYGTVGAPTRLQRMNYNRFVSDVMQSGNGSPTMYAIGNFDSATGQRVMYFYPWMTPGLTGQNYIVRYIYDPAPVANDSDVIPTPPMLDDVLIHFATRRCKIQEADYQAAQFLQSEIDQKLNEFTSYLNDHGDLSNWQIPEESVAAYSVFEV